MSVAIKGSDVPYGNLIGNTNIHIRRMVALVVASTTLPSAFFEMGDPTIKGHPHLANIASSISSNIATAILGYTLPHVIGV